MTSNDDRAVSLAGAVAAVEARSVANIGVDTRTIHRNGVLAEIVAALRALPSVSPVRDEVWGSAEELAEAVAHDREYGNPNAKETFAQVAARVCFTRSLPPTRVTEPELAKAIDAALMDAVRQHGTDGVKYWVLDGTVVSRGEVAARTALALLGER